MTRTLTNEQLREIAEKINLPPSNITTRVMAEMADELLANREAQPVAWSYEWASCITCEGPQNFKPVIEREAPPQWAIDEGQAKNVTPLYIAPPAPAFPERLPCPVRLMPGLLFGKGVPTASMLEALSRREAYEAEVESMTPEQKTENDARLEKLKALIPQPAPAAAGELLEAMEEIIRISDRDHEAWDKAKAAITACRGTMLNIWDLG